MGEWDKNIDPNYMKTSLGGKMGPTKSEKKGAGQTGDGSGQSFGRHDKIHLPL